MLAPIGSDSQEPPAWLRDDAVEANVPLTRSAKSAEPSSSFLGPAANNFLNISSSSSSSSSTGSATATSPSAGQPSDKLLIRNKAIVFWAMKVTSLGLCVLMTATAALGLITVNSVKDSERIYVAIYMFFFASLLFGFELMGVYPVEWVDHVYRRNFGFLYSTLYRAFFIIFIAFLSFGLGSPELLAFVTGLCWSAYGAGIIDLYLKYPTLFE